MPYRKPKKFLVSVQTLLIAASITLGVAIASTVSVLGYNGMNHALTAALEEQFGTIGVMVRERIRRLTEPVQSQLSILTHDQITTATDLSTRLSRLPVLSEALKSNATIRNIYVGYANGEFFLVRKIDNEKVRSLFNLDRSTAYLVQTITLDVKGNKVGEYRLYDANLRLQAVQLKPEYIYDPRERPWFQSSEGNANSVTSAPYSFFTTGEIGVTISQRSVSASSVIGFDATVDQLASEVQSLRLTPDSEIAITERDGTLIAYSDLSQLIRQDSSGNIVRNNISSLSSPILSVAAQEIGLSGPYRHGMVESSGRDWVVSSRSLDFGGDKEVRLLLAVPADNLFATTRKIIQDQGIVILIIVCLFIPFGILIIRQITKPLSQLSKDVQKLASFDFAHPIAVTSRVKEASELADTVDRLRLTVARFLEINKTIAGEKDFNTLLVKLLDEIIAATETQAGVLYLSDSEGESLLSFAARTENQQGPEVNEPPVTLSVADPLIRRAVTEKTTENMKVSSEALERIGLGKLVAVLDVVPSYLLVTPLFNRTNELVGVILLFEQEAIDPALMRFTEALSGSAAISVEARRLIAAQRELFESFIQLIAGAIDAKSPYTGGHCARVPELTKLLAKAANDSNKEPFADFCLSQDNWEAIHVAAWLHDCGKITTPEFVIDKATKLETIYDRIHEIRMRVEVIKRETEIRLLRNALEEQGASIDEAALSEALTQLDDDFAFVAKLNQGGEYLDDSKQERMDCIAQKTWTRTIDDRIGISHEELERKNRTAAPKLPIKEPLLADRPEHLFERPESEKLPEGNPWGFKMEVPELLYNRGELHNLSIQRGTLTPEDRYKINEHIVQTIKMLDKLPFPNHLKQVPELAGGHHEKMDGTGYPKRLRRDEMSPVSRMMAVADIFEALTAVDRPYKKGKKLSEAIKIMSFMVANQHIDPDIFRLFLESKVYLEYAHEYMNPDQIDEVQISEYLS
ncbi:HD domain-containing phosphohydrolase [Marinomonas pollencensis]|uniref:HD-GYP domain-containing protein (C-di-GMP phosphodiesterase class II) n=1 Tax=Marinomonas pollencensis TaxID=491954 RepID=A0A3E0DR97_9GAMM|nr:HD domain-containing phosphohydrolase [Marinomonas pollencensis]REG85655.1 HD-GYP domain-containing protein (c-di-GMP phosphodiesterase class II) [Marinomonas pollencensis]